MTMPSPPKRAKVESPTKPLSVVNRDSGGMQQPALMPEQDTELTRVLLESVYTQINHVQCLLAGIQRKHRKTKADLTRIAKYEKELMDLRLRKEQFNAAIPSASPAPPHARQAPSVVSPVFVKQEVRPIFVNQMPVATGSNVQLPPAYNATGMRTYGVPPQPQPSYVVTRYPSEGGSRFDEGDYDEDLNEDLNFIFGYDDSYDLLPPEISLDERYDDDGDFYGRGKDQFAGPVAKADDIDKFLIAAGNAEQFDGNASLEDALRKLGLDGLYRPLPGMEIALMPHQVIGVAWMLEKEHSYLKGGCNADEMGLGKTVQMIATLVSNRSEDPLRKTNLILAPVALLDQWQMELEMKTNCGLTCLIYHGPNKPRKKKELMQYDVVLTTFQTLALEWPDEEAEQRKAKAKAKRKKNRNDNFIETDSEDDRKSKKKRKSELGLLFEIEWYRVIIDEAQNIRNKRTRVSRAVTKLESKYRWCLTGTPIMNGLSDAYGLIRFLQARPWYDWDEFNGHITKLEKKRPELATSRLQVVFKSILLRRKKDSLLDGKRLIELPPKEVMLTRLQFTAEERDIYKMVEVKSQAIFNRFLRAGTVLKNYHQVLVLLLRLRQVCSHPCLIQEGNGAFISAADLDDHYHDKSYELSRAAQLVSPEFVYNMQKKLKETMLRRMEAEKESPDATVEEEECPICFDAFSDAVVTSCGHVFCKDCITNVFNSEPIENGDEPVKYRVDECPCPACRGVITKHKLFLLKAFEPSDDMLGASGASGSSEEAEVHDLDDSFAQDERPLLGRTLRKRKCRQRRVYDLEDEQDEDYDDDLSDFIVQDGEDEEEKNARHALKKRLGKRRAIVLSDEEDVDEDIICGVRPDPPRDLSPEQVKMLPRFLPSTKMKYMMERLRDSAEKHPGEKTLVISQWTQCLDLVSDYLTENKFVHVKYQGDMNRHKRDQAVRVFMSRDNATIMLMSLKCGGVGLNLTRANRVISLDLGWSEAVESQAFDRVHRLGQTRSVYVHRLVIADTVEDRVLALQERKKNLADNSLGEGNGTKVGRLSVRELANLFGLDHRGRQIDHN
ncbi:hypothetical protein WOLCODRAFT_145249 [Wolfiporia cocos MD-104 SS10]|uniref:Uncharacterized protein n=1 Tax=Wolfiporia cocos (strain MD-104) TaxID=742152 RepID=A0A2H3JS04_WOLCO|nr:hypothetical protein WOLCODRAFT_145249 [Wolfiporia cocos MD-104 SS10]